MYVLILFITTITNVNGTLVSQPGTKQLAEFNSLRECYNYAKEMKLNVEMYYCKPKNL